MFKIVTQLITAIDHILRFDIFDFVVWFVEMREWGYESWFGT